MFRFMQRFGRDSLVGGRGTGPMARVRRRNHRLNCEALESRQLLSGYYLVNEASGNVLDDPGGSTSNGAVIDQWQLNGGANQQWDLVALADGNDAIVNASSDKVLDDPDFSTSNGTPIQLYQPNGGLNQQWKPVALANGNYAIVNAYSGLVLGDPGYSASNGTQMIQWQWNGGLNEQWTLLAAGNAPAQTGYVVNMSSGNVLEDPNSSTSNGTGIDQNQLDGGTNQKWTFVELADGDYVIVSEYSGKVLDDPNSSTNNGTQVIQYQLNGGTNQQWEPLSASYTPVVTGYFKNVSSGKVLDDPNSSTSNGTGIIQYQLDDGTNQQWTLLDSANAPAVTDYVINASSGELVDDPGLSTANGTLVQQYPSNGSNNTPWTLVPLADGNVEIVNASTGKVLDDPDFSTSNATFIDQWQLNGGTNQQWTLVPLADGNDEIVNAFSNKVLDDPAFSRANGTDIDQWQLNGGMNQQWVLFVPNTSATSSPNWSGYVATTSLSNPQNDSVTYVAGTWTVPTVTATSGNTHSFAWVGIDGHGNHTVEQAGTAQGINNGVPYYYAWWEMWSSIDLQNLAQRITTMTVSPGDSITASVTYQTSGTHAGDYLLSINDTSHSNDSFNIYASPSQYQDPLPDRSTAEWIMEAPTVGGSITTLPNFGTVTFTNCSATINGTTGPINASSWQSQAENLSSNGVTYDTTSVLNHSGTGFTVLYDSAGTAGQSATTANGLTQVSSTVGATLQSVQNTGRQVIRRHAGTGAPGLRAIP